MQNVTGVVAEYNPFHNGHRWHLLQSGSPIICVMSGHVTQRGEFSLCRKHIRAEMAVRCGASLVLELPSVWACAGAEAFAAAAVGLLAATGVVTRLSFGCEAEALDTLQTLAALLEAPDFPSLLRQELAGGVSFASARQKAAERLAGRALPELESPNNILALEYLKALRGKHIEPHAVLRRGAGHDAADTSDGYASASLLRRLFWEGQDLSSYVPQACAALLEAERNAARAPVRLDDRAVLSHLRRMGADDFAALPEVSEGLEHRLADKSRTAQSLFALYDALKCKRYAHARLRRILLCAYLGITAAHRAAPLPYLRVLAANEEGLSLLHTMRHTAALPILTKPASVRALDTAARESFALETRVTDLYTLCYPAESERAGGTEWRTGPIVIKGVPQ